MDPLSLPAEVIKEREERRKSGVRAPISEEYVVTSLSAVRHDTKEPAAPASVDDASSGRHTMPPGLARLEAVIQELDRAAPGHEGPLVDRLLKMGRRALPVLAESFPGHLWFHPRVMDLRLPRGRAVSGIAAALVAFGPDALRHIERGLTHSDPQVRYATLLVWAELAPDSTCERALPLVFDPSPPVASAATAALHAREGEHGFEATMRALRDELKDSVPSRESSADDLRERVCRALRALRILRDPVCVPRVIELLSRPDPHADVTIAARETLGTITARHFNSAAAWRKWHARNATKPRIEWVLDAARSRNVTDRELAMPELERLLGAPPDFDPHAGWWTRRQAHSRLRRTVASRSHLSSPPES